MVVFWAIKFVKAPLPSPPLDLTAAARRWHEAHQTDSDSAHVGVQKPLSESIRFLAVLWGQPTQKDKEALGCPVLSFDEVAEKVRQNLTGFEANPVQISGSDLATLVYTSGTTGNPKVIAYCHDRLLWCSAQILDHTIAMHVAVCVRACVRALNHVFSVSWSKSLVS